MKRRRISAAFVELDSVEVIQSKDKQASSTEARVLTSPQNQNRRSPRIASKAGATPEVKFTPDTRMSNDQIINNGERGGVFNTQRKADTPHLADIASNPRDIEHAILTKSQPKSFEIDKIGEAITKDDQRQLVQKSNRISYVKPQCPGQKVITRSVSATSDPEEILQRTHSPMPISSKGGSSGLTKPEVFEGEAKSLVSNTQQQSTASRPRRSTRKSYVLQTKANVDLSEDLRPTDEDERVPDGMERNGPLITSPNSGHANQPERPSKYRQQAGQKKSTTRKTLCAKKVKHENNQLPLTAVHVGNVHTESRAPDAGLGMPLVNINFMDMHDTIDISENTPVREMRQLSKPDMRSKYQAPIEISRLSLDDCDQTMTDSPTKDEISRKDIPNSAEFVHGRGKAVGKKLTNAFRGPKKRLSVGRARDVPPVPVTQAPVSRNTRSQSLLRRKPRMDQAKDSTRNPFKEDIDLTPSKLTVDPEISPRRTEVIADAASTAKLNQAQKSSKNNESTEPETRNDGATRFDDVSGHDSSLSLPSDNTGNRPRDLPRNAPKEDGQHSESFEPETSVSSQISAESENHAHEASLPPAIEQTPESQRPLLTEKPQISSIPGNISLPECQWSEQRGCTVDPNGSPRLRPQVNTRTGLIHPHPRMNHMRSVSETSDSSSIYSTSSDEESLDGYCLEHHPVVRPRPRWTKFQHDMLREYGIEAEQLLRQRKSPVFPGKGKNDVYAKRVEDRQELGTQPARLQTPMHKATSGETKTHSICQAKSPERPQRVFQRMRYGSGQCSDQRKYEPARSAQYASRTDPTSISSSLAQDGPGGMDWISALKAAQQTAHDQLLKTNQSLSIQLAAEQESIRDVLQIYRQGCNRMLQDLFRAQELRMDLYQRQMVSVKGQHIEICQDLIRELQELDCQLQQGSEPEVSRYPIFPRP